MKKMRPSYIRDGFYRDLAVLVAPIAVQNFITAAVGTADVVMLGLVGQTALSASALAGQVMFILNIVYYGLNSSLVILASQYWGRGDTKTISRIFGIGLIISMSFSFSAMVLALVCPAKLMMIWTNDPELIEVGSQYLRYVAPSYGFMGISEVYLVIMKSMERVKLSTVVSGLTLGLNICLNAVLIFGLFGAPEMGAIGAALATSIARGIGLAICIGDAVRQRLIKLNPAAVFRIPGILVQDFLRYSLPAFLNDAGWGFATSMFSVIMGRLGSDIVAANSVVVTTRNLFTTVGFGIASGAAILIGKELGENQMEKARDDARAVMFTAVLVSIAAGALIALIMPVVPGLVNISETARGYLRIMLFISIFYQMGIIVNTVLIASLFRAGGESKTGLIMDMCAMWLWAVPAGLISAFVLHLPPIVVYLILSTDEFVKIPFALRHYRSGRWLRNITR